MEVPPHFIHCFTTGRARRTKDPSAFRATWSLSILLFGPYQFTGRTSLSLMEHAVEHAALASGQGNGMSKSSMRGRVNLSGCLAGYPLSNT